MDKDDNVNLVDFRLVQHQDAGTYDVLSISNTMELSASEQQLMRDPRFAAVIDEGASRSTSKQVRCPPPNPRHWQPPSSLIQAQRGVKNRHHTLATRSDVAFLTSEQVPSQPRPNVVTLTVFSTVGNSISRPRCLQPRRTASASRAATMRLSRCLLVGKQTSEMKPKKEEKTERRP